jgi:hypothetical protein
MVELDSVCPHHPLRRRRTLHARAQLGRFHSDPIEIRAGWRGGLSLRCRLLLLRRSKTRWYGTSGTAIPRACRSNHLDTGILGGFCNGHVGQIHTRYIVYEERLTFSPGIPPGNPGRTASVFSL